jgi:hypothetical protein
VRHTCDSLDMGNEAYDSGRWRLQCLLMGATRNGGQMGRALVGGENDNDGGAADNHNEINGNTNGDINRENKNRTIMRSMVKQW